MEIPITQSKAWAKLQDDLDEKSFLEQGKEYHYLAILKHTPVGNYLYCPYGPIAKNKAGFHQALKSLQALAREQSAIFIRVEPYTAEMAKYLPKNTKKSKDLNPKETWLLDLTGNDNDLKAKLPSRLIRYYKSAAKKGITIEQSHNPDDIRYLLDLQKALADKKGISTFSEDYLKTELRQPFATLYLVRYQDPSESSHRRVTSPKGDPQNVCDSKILGEEAAAGPAENCIGETRPESLPAGSTESYENRTRPEVIAAGLVFDDKTTRYNLQGAQTEQGRKLHATGILTIQLILDAKAQGKKIFDFWGIAPEGATSTHPWAGFTNFKKTFQGYQQDHAGTYDIIENPIKYHIYQMMRKINHLIRKTQ